MASDNLSEKIGSSVIVDTVNPIKIKKIIKKITILVKPYWTFMKNLISMECTCRESTN
ncbi:MAG: hypothetical protein OEL56_07125 [Nitrosopumilus sp.]|nr:hypothetical protein [Nitrosopumilus sp.]MDH3490205.1 hypothetical protein [Nitrosopumilus sp.]MDH3516944.1 hypothetical protein [Nitrosopumilus sp.]MDH3565319.1 hypothetical protein [Nitrosopumilus sp.]MDH5417021.1 hypothetical protein [Nitrosopumilus sp.]